MLKTTTKNSFYVSSYKLYIIIYIYIYISESESHLVVYDSLQPHELYSPWNSPGRNTRVGSHSLLQGIFPMQGSNPVSHIAGGFFTSWATRESIYITYIFFLLKKIIDIKGTFHARMGMIKDRNNKYLTEEIKTRWQEYTELFKKKS